MHTHQALFWEWLTSENCSHVAGKTQTPLETSVIERFDWWFSRTFATFRSRNIYLDDSCVLRWNVISFFFFCYEGASHLSLFFSMNWRNASFHWNKYFPQITTFERHSFDSPPILNIPTSVERNILSQRPACVISTETTSVRSEHLLRSVMKGKNPSGLPTGRGWWVVQVNHHRPLLAL